jgi:hypothetical protein
VGFVLIAAAFKANLFVGLPYCVAGGKFAFVDFFFLADGTCEAQILMESLS